MLKYLGGYKGDPLIRCTPECQSDYDCADNQVCSGVRCSPICTEGTCGKNANCLPQNHRAICKCPTGYLGDPLSGCRLECQYNSECPSERSVCSYNRCIDVCKGVCGTNAICEVSGNKAICSCPKNMTGHPFEYCRPFDTRDLCEPNPCGRNAQCQPGYDNTGKDRPVCTCLPGYVGNGVVGCVRGECTSNYDCPDHSVCSSSECVNACSNVCGVVELNTTSALANYATEASTNCTNQY
uniref:EGF-like domain-containing protein n=1 Tax=Timema douglasi TaxID=61478 RepID=A0A7R8VNH3_TIMDO|nr:unnamed protein product [Timema douglasi]